MLATARAEKAEAKVQQLEDQVARCSCGRNPGVHGTRRLCCLCDLCSVCDQT
jgi:hypothetical protein